MDRSGHHFRNRHFRQCSICGCNEITCYIILMAIGGSMRRIMFVGVMALSLFAGNAMADSINGRLGLTGRLGLIVPLKDLTISGSESGKHDTGFAGGGGLIYGIGNNFALELEVIHAPATDVTSGGVKIGEQQTTDVSLGLQYRIMPERSFVPYVAVGADAIKG